MFTTTKWRLRKTSHIKDLGASNSKNFRFKLLRAAGGCLGIKRRRRTRKPAKSLGELDKALTRGYPNGGTQYK